MHSAATEVLSLIAAKNPQLAIAQTALLTLGGTKYATDAAT
jgi:hypothetical protein